MASSFHFSTADQDRIAEAVRVAESNTSGEIVPVIVESSARYPEAVWKAIFLGIAVGLVLYELYLFLFEGWETGFWSTLLSGTFFIVAGGGASFIASRTLPGFKRWLIGRAAMDEAVHSRALKAFVDHEVFSTKERTGVLLLVSLFEHRVEVFGDSGINAKVKPDDWAEVIALVVTGIRSGKPAEGLISGIRYCGELLKSLGLAIRENDVNERSDRARFE